MDDLLAVGLLQHAGWPKNSCGRKTFRLRQQCGGIRPQITVPKEPRRTGSAIWWVLIKSVPNCNKIGKLAYWASHGGIHLVDRGFILSEGSLVRGFGHLKNHSQRKQDKQYTQCNNSLPFWSVRVRTHPDGQIGSEVWVSASSHSELLEKWTLGPVNPSTIDYESSLRWWRHLVNVVAHVLTSPDWFLSLLALIRNIN